MPNRPLLIVEIEVVHRPHISVGRVNREAVEIPDVPKHRRLPWPPCPLGPSARSFEFLAHRKACLAMRVRPSCHPSMAFHRPAALARPFPFTSPPARHASVYLAGSLSNVALHPAEQK